MQPTTNANVFSQYRLGVKSDMSDRLKMTTNSQTQLKTVRDLERGNTPAISSKTLIYDQSRIVSPTNYYGTRFIRNIDPYYKINPAGIDGRNSTTQSGVSFTKPFVKAFPQYL